MANSSTSNINTKAYVVHNAKDDFKLENITLGDMQPNELLVEMKYSGVCHTDLIFQQGEIPICEYPAIFGHEGAGTIKAIGSKVKNKDLKVGDFVLLSINYCEQCKWCKDGHPADCTEGTRLHLFGVRPDGTTAAKLANSDKTVRSHFFGHSSFSNMSYVQETCVVKCPCPAEEAAKFSAMGCGYQTGAGTVLNILQPKPQDSIVIFGLGTVGLTALMAAKHLDLRQIIAVDVQEAKLPIAKELGATETVNSRQVTDIADHIKKLTSGGADFCIDCTGVLAVIEAMPNCLTMRGTAAIVGVPPSGKKISIDPLQYLLGSRKLVGCREGDSLPTKFVPELIELQKKGRFPVEKLVTVYDYKDLGKALDDLHHGKVIKPVLQWS